MKEVLIQLKISDAHMRFCQEFVLYETDDNLIMIGHVFILQS